MQSQEPWEARSGGLRQSAAQQRSTYHRVSCVATSHSRRHVTQRKVHEEDEELIVTFSITLLYGTEISRCYRSLEKAGRLACRRPTCKQHPPTNDSLKASSLAGPTALCNQNTTGRTRESTSHSALSHYLYREYRSVGYRSWAALPTLGPFQARKSRSW